MFFAVLCFHRFPMIYVFYLCGNVRYHAHWFKRKSMDINFRVLFEFLTRPTSILRLHMMSVLLRDSLEVATSPLGGQATETPHVLCAFLFPPSFGYNENPKYTSLREIEHRFFMSRWLQDNPLKSLENLFSILNRPYIDHRTTLDRP